MNKPTYEELRQKVIALEKEKAEKDEAKYRMLIDNINDLVCEVDGNGFYTFVSNNYKEILGYEPEELIGKPAIELIHPDDLEASIKKYELLKNNSGRSVDVWRFLHKNGTYRYIESKGKVYQYGESEQRTVIISRDITASKEKEFQLNQANQKVELSEKRYKNLFENLVDEVHVWELVKDEKGQIINWKLVDVNPAALVSWHKTKKEVVGKLVTEIFGKEAKELFAPIVNKIFETGKPYKWETYFSPTKQYLAMDSIPLGNFFISTGRDVTDRITDKNNLIKAKESAEAMAADLKLAQQIANIGNWEFDPRIGVPVWSDHIYEIYERDPKLNPPHIDEYKNIYERDQYEIFIKAFTTAVKQGKNYNIVLRLKLPEKKTKWVRAICHPDTANKTPKGYFLRGTIQDITENKEKELKLLASEDRHRRLFEKIPSGVAVYTSVNNGKDFRFEAFNKAAERITNTTKENVVGRTLLELFPNMGPSPLYAALQKVNSDSTDIYLEPFFYKDHIREGWRENYIYKLSTGEIVAIFTDVTKSKNLEIELKDQNEALILAKKRIEESEQRLKLASQSAKLGVWDWNVKENIMVWDERMYELYGITKETFVKTVDAWLNGLHPDDKEVAIAECNLALEGIHNFDTTFRVKHPDGKVLYIKADGIVLRDAEGKAVRMLGVNRDITKGKLNEIELQRAKDEAEDLKERFDYATSIGEVGTWDWDVNTNELIWSNFTYQLLGYDPDKVKPTYDLFLSTVHPDDRKMLEAQLNKALHEKLPYDVDCRIVRNNEIRICNTTGKVEYDTNGKPVRMVGIFQDITQRKMAENQVLQAKQKAEEANRLKIQFLNNMSHEVRTPMNGIMGFSKMLDKKNLPEVKRKYYARIIQNSSKQLLRVIDDILAISTLETKQEKLYVTAFCLNDLLMELFSIFNLKSNERSIPLYLKKGLHDDQSFIMSDKTKLNKIISNLLENALKFTNEGYVEFGYTLEKNMLEIYVKDTGIGIASEKQEMIFDRFSQEDKEVSRKHGGLGLGLSISKENACLLGGDIRLQSQKGEGSIFYVTIPFTPAQPDKHSNDAIVNYQEPHDQYTVLVAEDEEVNYLYIEALFEEEIDGSYKLIHAKNGKEAVEYCVKNSDIDIVLMDIKMPIMNGHEAAKKIKKKTPNLPIIAQTAYSTEDDKALAIQHGCNEFISKPLDKEQLHKMLHKYLEKK